MDSTILWDSNRKTDRVMVAVKKAAVKKVAIKKKASKVEHMPGSNAAACTGALLAVGDAMDVLYGRWKIPILIALADEPKRFRQIAKDITGITDKMLSKELKEMEMNELVTRTVHGTFPPTVEYARTEYSNTLGSVLTALREWGSLHREKIMGKK